MININKAHFDVDGDNLRLTMPIAKVDEERRIVSGFATLDNVDRQGDVLLSEASRKAFENFRGNVRLMHQPIPAGKVVSFRENSFYDKETGNTYSGIFVDAYISKGAENIWQMVLDGTLTGFSIGGRILDYENSLDKSDNPDDPVRVVKEYELMELSLVDSPANQFANIFSIQKLGDEIVTSGIATEFSTENVFWCHSDNIAIAEKSENASCPVCKGNMSEIGWVESNDINKNEEIGRLVDGYLSKADSLDEEDSDSGKDEMNKETVTNEATANKNPRQGISSGIPKEKKKKKITYKSDSSPIETNDFVAFKEGSSLEKGRVELLNDSKASIRLYKQIKDNTFSSTSTIIIKDISELTKIKVSSIKKSLDSDILGELKHLVYQHNEKYGNVMHKSVTLNNTLEVYSRGIEAFNASPAKSNEEMADVWAKERVNGFLNAIAKGKFKKMPYDTDLLPTGHPLSTKKSTEVESSPLALQKQEGGVEVADNETGHEELDTAQAPDETSEEVEFDVEETVEDVVNEALAMAKSDGVEADAEDTSSEVFDMEKALGDVKSFVEDALAKTVESSTESLDKITSAVLELSKAVDEKIGQLQSKYDEVTKSLADLSTATTEIASRVESVEEETAIKKSGELENSIPEQPVMRKSLWGGRFLSSADLFN